MTEHARLTSKIVVPSTAHEVERDTSGTDAPPSVPLESLGSGASHSGAGHPSTGPSSDPRTSQAQT